MKIKNSAFTLIELLIVIVIIGILATIAFSTFKGYFKKANNTQRITVVKQYIDALKRMNASGESFPITKNKGKGYYKHIVCLFKTETGTCHDSDIHFSQEVKDQFDKHLKGINKSKKVDLGSINRDGIIYSYPATFYPKHISEANRYGFPPAKTAILQFIMDGKNFNCEAIDGGVTAHSNYNNSQNTYCVVFVEDKI